MQNLPKTPAPVTPADLKRAAYFGLKLPAVSRAIETPDLGNHVVVITGDPTVISIRTTALRPADAREVRSWLGHMESLVEAGEDDGWEAWHDEVCIELGPEAEPIETDAGYRPEPEAFAPSAEDQAWWLGHRLGEAGEYPAPPEGTPRVESMAFYMGRLAGFTLSPEGLEWQEDMRRWRDRMDRERAEAERVNTTTDQDAWPVGCPS